MTDEVTVTQADREAAVRIMADRWNTVHKAKVLNGNADNWIPVQECARHRIEATRQAEADKAELVEALEVIRKECIPEKPAMDGFFDVVMDKHDVGKIDTLIAKHSKEASQ